MIMASNRKGRNKNEKESVWLHIQTLDIFIMDSQTVGSRSCVQWVRSHQWKYLRHRRTLFDRYDHAILYHVQGPRWVLLQGQGEEFLRGSGYVWVQVCSSTSSDAVKPWIIQLRSYVISVIVECRAFGDIVMKAETWTWILSQGNLVCNVYMHYTYNLFFWLQGAFQVQGFEYLWMFFLINVTQFDWLAHVFRRWKHRVASFGSRASNKSLGTMCPLGALVFHVTKNGHEKFPICFFSSPLF